jgi:uracil phosphoribosyltransferase
LVQHKLSLLRQRETPPMNFRALVAEISQLLAYEAFRTLPLDYKPIETPLTPMQAPFVDGKQLILVSILRAGNGMLEGVLPLVPSAEVGQVGLFRDHQTLQAVEYYVKLPQNLAGRGAIVLDPMLATGNSAVAALDHVKRSNPASIGFICLLSAPAGLLRLQQAHPDVSIFTAAIDERLNEHGYIVPGLGDAGDRLYGT